MALDRRLDVAMNGGAMGRGVRPLRLALASICWCVAAAAFPAETARGPVHVLMINGGDEPASNYLSHLHHLQDMVAVLQARGVPTSRIHVFSADGQDPAADLTTRDVAPADFWLLEGTALGKRLRPPSRLVNTEWRGVTLHPARLGRLREWFESARARIRAGDRLLVFVTDHGTGDEQDVEDAAISLWREKLTVRGLRALLARLRPGVQVVMVMSQCFSGAFSNVIGDGPTSEPSGDVCGFFSTTAEREAYGCYPEGRDRDRIGHAFHFIEALGRRATTAEAHVEVLTSDATPDVPLRTSDAYLARIVAAEAAARETTEDELVDSLLAEAWRRPAAWEGEIRLLDAIGTTFGTFSPSAGRGPLCSPRRLGEIESRQKEIDALAKQMSTFTDRWQGGLADLREGVLQDFQRARADWRARLEPRMVDALGTEERAALLAELLPPLVEHARGQPDLWPKLQAFRSRAERGAEALWRLEVREAALQRMRTLLVAVAGAVLVEARAVAETDTARRRGGGSPAALERLRRCEALVAGDPPPGGPSTRAPAAPPFPSLSDELALVEEISPSWLGVRFRPVARSVRAARHLPDGANLLDAVFPGSPAEEAGLQAGDIVIGPPGRPFEAGREMREWAMTSPRGTPLPLRVVRPDHEGGADRVLEVALVLRAMPVDLPSLAGPPAVGDRAPLLPSAVVRVGAGGLPDLHGQSHLLFFWATWCAPCKAAVPEVMALARSRNLPVVAISDEDEGTVARFLALRTEAFFTLVAVDPLRASFIAYGVSGTPTMVLVGADGVIHHRQVGYAADKGLSVEGWRWPGR